jgi:hypothetical protein
MRRFGGPAAVANVTALAIWNDAEADEREMAGRAAWPIQWRLSHFEGVVTSIIPSSIRRLR